MRKISCLCLVVFHLVLCSQSDSVKVRRFAIGLTYSPDYCYRMAYYSGSNTGTTSATETPRYGCTIGLNLVVHITKRLSGETGVLFSDRGEQVNLSIASYTLPPPKDPFVPAYTTGISGSKTTYHYYYMDIPVKANFCLLTGKIKLYITAGISNSFFLSEKSIRTVEYSNGNKDQRTVSDATAGTTNYNFMALAGFGLRYDVSKRFFFRLEPMYRQSLRATLDKPVNGYFYTLGLNTGIYLVL